MVNKITATAKVQITIEVTGGAWGPECSIGQLHQQAAESATQRVHSVFCRAADANADISGMRIVGEPKVLGVVTIQP